MHGQKKAAGFVCLIASNLDNIFIALERCCSLRLKSNAGQKYLAVYVVLLYVNIKMVFFDRCRNNANCIPI